MRKIFYYSLANLVFIVHFALVLILTVGWLVPGMYYFFLGVIVTVFLVDVTLGYCPLTLWEFNIRKKLNPAKIYDKTFTAHYLRALVGIKPKIEVIESKNFFKKHSFKFTLIGLFLLGTSFHIFVF